MQEKSQNTSEGELLDELIEDKTPASGETMTKEALYKLLESQSDCV